MTIRPPQFFSSTQPSPDRSARDKAVAVPAPQPRSRVAVCLFALVFAVAAMIATRASGQQKKYAEIPMHKAFENERTAKAIQSEAKSFAGTGNGRGNYVNAYFGLYVASKMTQQPDGLKEMDKLTQEMRTLLSRAQRSGNATVYAQLSKYIFDAMKKVAAGDHHPAARINAIQILSRLDRVPADTSSRRPPEPLMQVLPVLLNLYEDDSNVDGVRAAALHGIHRHVSYNFAKINPAGRTKLASVMNDLLESDPPANRSPEAHAYLQRFAVDMLDSMRPPQDPNLGMKLISISTEPKKPNLIALYSASRLGAMGDVMKGKVADPDPILKGWLKRVLEAYQTEVARLEQLERPAAARTQPPKPESFLVVEKKDDKATAAASMMDDEAAYGMMDMEMEMGMDEMEMEMMGGMDGMEAAMMMSMGGAQEAAPQPPEVRASRRMLNSVLQQIQVGATGTPKPGIPSRNPGGLLLAVAPEKAQAVKDWVTAMEPIITELNDELLDDRKKFFEKIQEQTEQLKEMVGEEEQIEPPADPADSGDELAPAPAEAPPADAAPAPAADGLEPVDELAG